MLPKVWYFLQFSTNFSELLVCSVPLKSKFVVYFFFIWIAHRPPSTVHDGPVPEIFFPCLPNAVITLLLLTFNKLDGYDNRTTTYMIGTRFSVFYLHLQKNPTLVHPALALSINGILCEFCSPNHTRSAEFSRAYFSMQLVFHLLFLDWLFSGI